MEGFTLRRRIYYVQSMYLVSSWLLLQAHKIHTKKNHIYKVYSDSLLKCGIPKEKSTNDRIFPDIKNDKQNF